MGQASSPAKPFGHVEEIIHEQKYLEVERAGDRFNRERPGDASPRTWK
jgi:hypothetical protein